MIELYGITHTEEVYIHLRELLSLSVAVWNLPKVFDQAITISSLLPPHVPMDTGDMPAEQSAPTLVFPSPRLLRSMSCTFFFLF